MNAPLRRAVLGGPLPRPTCHRCWHPASTCICATIEPVANRTGVIVFQHPRERFHPIGTARIAALGLRNVRVASCAPWSDGGALRERLPDRTALLYPTPGAPDLADLGAAERPQHLLVLDGTWFLAKKIYDAFAWLRELPHVRLTPAEISRYGGVRRQPARGCIATIEAIVMALEILEPDTVGLDGLLRAFSVMVEKQMARGAIGRRGSH